MCAYLCQIQTPHKKEAELLRDSFMAEHFKHLVFPSNTCCRAATHSLQRPHVFHSVMLYLHLSVNIRLL